MKNIVQVDRSVYFPYLSQEGSFQARTFQVFRYLGTGLRREEVMMHQSDVDWWEEKYRRTSEDNGATWSEWETLQEACPRQNDCTRAEHVFASVYNPAAGHTIQFSIQEVFLKAGPEALHEYFQTGQDTFVDHVIYHISDDEGRSWSDARILRYEPGPEFDPNDWANAEYLRSNRMYGGYSATLTREGTIVFPSGCIPMTIQYRGEEQQVSGARVFVGRWDPQAGEYTWEVSEPLAMPLQQSGRGIAEPCIEELTDGRLLMIMRGSTDVHPPVEGVTVESPGRHWHSLSENGGRTWSEIQDLRYDTGEQFYSPCSFGRLLRHSNGKLYWFGNICPDPPQGSFPRDPLVMAEVDESIPALKKNTVTILDQREEDKPLHERFQLSNFHLLENRQTHEIELVMNRYGEDPEHWLKANTYLYRLRLLEE